MALVLQFLFDSHNQERLDTRKLSMFCLESFLVAEKGTMYRRLVARVHPKSEEAQTIAFAVDSFRHFRRGGINRRYPINLVSQHSIHYFQTIETYIISVYWVAIHKFVINL